MSNFFVRFAAPIDTPSIKKIADANKGALGFIPQAKVNDAIKQQRVLVLCTDQELTGFVIYRHRKTDSQTTLSDICVVEAWRGQKGGHQLMQALVQDCVEHERSFILLKCPTELKANYFYEKVGFTRVGIDNGNRRPLNIWRLDINRNEAG